MTTIIFVRHAESDANVFLHKGSNSITHFTQEHKEIVNQQINALGNPSITNVGQKQSETVGKYLVQQLLNENVKSEQILVSTSLFDRAESTAQSFVDEWETTTKQKLNLFSDPLLCEYTSPDKKLSSHDLSKGITPHESWEHFTDQVKTFVQFMENVREHDYVIIFGHSLFLSAMTSYIGSSKMFMPNKSQLVFRVPNCSITTFQYSKKSPEDSHQKWKIHQQASIAHLPKELVTGRESSFGTIL
jgi:broad specificity phosphatase PhoE